MPNDSGKLIAEIFWLATCLSVLCEMLCWSYYYQSADVVSDRSSQDFARVTRNNLRILFGILAFMSYYPGLCRMRRWYAKFVPMINNYVRKGGYPMTGQWPWQVPRNKIMIKGKISKGPDPESNGRLPLGIRDMIATSPSDPWFAIIFLKNHDYNNK